MFSATDDSNVPDLHVCAVCGRPLAYVRTVHSVTGEAIERGWIHDAVDRQDEDHPAVPVPAGAVPVVGRCDFCSDPHPVVAFPARSFPMMDMPGWLAHETHGLDTDEASFISHSEWSACSACAVLVAAENWNGVLLRAKRAYTHLPVDLRSEVLQHLAGLYRTLALNLSGPMHPINETPDTNRGAED